MHYNLVVEKKITFLLNLRYPTEKAYGVTTHFSVKALEKIGCYSVQIITPHLDNNIKSDSEIIQIEMPFLHIYRFLQNRIKKMQPVFFVLWNWIYPFKLLFFIRRDHNLIWARDIFTSLIFTMARYTVVCEIHRSPALLNRLPFFLLKKLKKSFLLPITENLRNELKIPISRSTIASMSVNENELLHKKKENQTKKIVIGYIGSPFSSDKELSVDCVLEAASILRNSAMNIQFRFIGLTRSVNHNSTYPKNIEFIGKINRSNIIEELDKFDIGLLIYPESQYFRESFPIKIVEYAARKVPIIASDTICHRNILDKERALFFNLNSAQSLVDAILLMVSNQKLKNHISENCFEWVKQLTYENRVRAVLLLTRF